MTVDRSRLPDLGPEVSVRFPPVERRTLPSGLRVWFVERQDVPVLTLLLVVPSGSASDPDQHPGLAALTGDLLDEGSGGRDAIAFHAELARIGGQLGTDTGYDATLIGLTSLSRFHREAVGLMADVAFRPQLDETDFARVRELRCNRLAQMRDQPAALAEQAFVEEVFGSHPYGHLPIGREPSLRALPVDTVRAFHATRYRPRGSLLIAVGAVAGDALIEAVGAAFPDVDTGQGVDFGTLPLPASPGDGRRLVLVERPQAPQSELRVGHLAVARATPDYHDLLVLNALLGGQFVSRINLNLREEKGFTYGARSGFDWRRSPGPFVVQTSVQTDATAAAVKEILREIEDVAGNRPPTESELALAKASLTRGFARNFETADQVARGLAQLAVYDLPATWFDEFVDRVRAVDGAAVGRAAHHHLHPERATVSVVGDRARIERELEALDFTATRFVRST